MTHFPLCCVPCGWGWLWQTSMEEFAEFHWSKFDKWDHALNGNRKVSCSWIFYWQHFWLPSFQNDLDWDKTDTGGQIGPLHLLFMKFNTVEEKARVTRLNCLNHIHQIYVLNHHQSKLFQVCSFSTCPFTPIQNLPSYLRASRFWMKKSGAVCNLAKWRSPSTQYRMKPYRVYIALTRSQRESHTKMGDHVLGVSVFI